MNAIETKSLTKYYGDARGIVDVNLTVEKGEIYGFVGPNGAGKSTTIRTLLGLIFPTSGSAKIFGKDTIKYGPDVRKNLGYLPSEVFYYDNMKVKDLLAYSASFYPKAATKRMRQLADRLNLDLERKIDDLSYGNKKKVGIVQGLQHSPKLIILDEPTGGLDPLMQNTFFDILDEEKQRGTTVFFSSHILGEVQKLCDRVAIIKEGEIIKVENVAALLRDNYRKFKLQVRGKVDQSKIQQDGVTNLEVKKDIVTFLFKGELNKMTRIIATLNLQSMWVEEPTLEEIFIHYYQ